MAQLPGHALALVDMSLTGHSLGQPHLNSMLALSVTLTTPRHYYADLLPARLLSMLRSAIANQNLQEVKTRWSTAVCRFYVDWAFHSLDQPHLQDRAV